MSKLERALIFPIIKVVLNFVKIYIILL